jgi:lia operon protein LiaG
MSSLSRTVTVMAVLVGAGTAEAQETHRITGRDVAVYNLAGKARVVAGNGSDVVVRITRGGSDAGRLEVETGAVGGRETLRVIYPDDQVVYPGMGRRSSNSTRVRPDGTFGGGGPRGDRVEIRGGGRGLEAWADLVIEVPSGKEFALYLAVGEVEAEGVSANLTIDTGSGSVDVRDVVGSLNVDTGSGSVDVRGVEGTLFVDTGSGSVFAMDVSGGEINIDTGSGGVRGSGLTAERMRVDTGSGSIELDEVTAPRVVLDTGSGSVDLVLLTDVEVLDVDTGSGSVTIRAPEDLGAEIDIETGSGGIDLDFPVRVRSMRRDEVSGTLGDGQGRIRIDTGSGGVRLIRN